MLTSFYIWAKWNHISTIPLYTIACSILWSSKILITFRILIKTFFTCPVCILSHLIANIFPCAVHFYVILWFKFSHVQCICVWYCEIHFTCSVNFYLILWVKFSHVQSILSDPMNYILHVQCIFIWSYELLYIFTCSVHFYLIPEKN